MAEKPLCPLTRTLCREDCEWYDKTNDQCVIGTLTANIRRIAISLEKEKQNG